MFHERTPTSSLLVVGDGRSLESPIRQQSSPTCRWEPGQAWGIGEGGRDVHFRQIILSQLYFEARALREGSMMPPRRRRTRCRVDSCSRAGHQRFVFQRPAQFETPADSLPGPLLLLPTNSFVDATYFLDVVIRQRTPVLQLLPGEDQTLLVRGDTLLVLDLGLDIVDGVGGFDFERDGFTREGFDEAVTLSVLCGRMGCCG